MTDTAPYTCCHCVNFEECGCGIGDPDPHGFCHETFNYVNSDEPACEDFELDYDL